MSHNYSKNNPYPENTIPYTPAPHHLPTNPNIPLVSTSSNTMSHDRNQKPKLPMGNIPMEWSQQMMMPMYTQPQMMMRLPPIAPPRAHTSSAPPPSEVQQHQLFIPHSSVAHTPTMYQKSQTVKITDEHGKEIAIKKEIIAAPTSKITIKSRPPVSWTISDSKGGAEKKPEDKSVAPQTDKVPEKDSSNAPEKAPENVSEKAPEKVIEKAPDTTVKEPSDKVAEKSSAKVPEKVEPKREETQKESPISKPKPSAYQPPHKRQSESADVSKAPKPSQLPQEHIQQPLEQQKPHSEPNVRQNGVSPAVRPPSPQAITTEGRYLNSQDDSDTFSGDGSEDDADFDAPDEDETPIETGVKRVYTVDELMDVRDRVMKNLKERRIHLDFAIKETLKNYGVYLDKPLVASHPDDTLKKKRQQERRSTSRARLNKVKLTRGENAWVPGILNNKKDVKEKVRLEMNDILNKITPEKFDRLQATLLSMEEINNKESVEVMVNCIQEKALLEPKFSDLYARLCSAIVNAPSFKANSSLFRKSLITAAEQEFQKSSFYRNESEDTEGKTPEELEEIRDKERLRALGNIRFLGELFRMKILSSVIIHEVIKDLLLRNPSPSKIEVACQLLTSVGSLLDIKEGEKIMDIYFLQLKRIVNDPPKGYNTRILFLIESVIELRDNNWVPRIKEEKAKKLNQVLEDHHREEVEKRTELKEKRIQGKYKKAKPQEIESGWQTTSSKRKHEVKTPSRSNAPTVATKGKFAVFEESIESPASPAPSEIEEFDEKEAKKQIKFFINSYLEDPSEDPISEIGKVIDYSAHPTLVPLSIFELCTNSKLDTDACSELLSIALKRSVFTKQDIEKAFAQFYDRVLAEQVFLDCALVFKTMAGIAPQFMQLDSLHEILSEGQDKYPHAGVRVDDIAFFVCEALRQIRGESIEEALKRNQRFVPLHCVNTTKKIQLTMLLRHEGIKSLKGDLYDIWALEHVMSNVEFSIQVQFWNARAVACGLIAGIELLGPTQEKYSEYKEKLSRVASFSPKIIVEELKRITKRYPEGDTRLEKSKGFLVNLGIISQQVADSVKS